MSDNFMCESCHTFDASEAVCVYCRMGYEKNAADEARKPIQEIEKLAPGTPLRIVAKLTKGGAGFDDGMPWLVTVNVGGWRKGRSFRAYGVTMVDAIACALRPTP